MVRNPLIAGSRGSTLALKQTQAVIDALTQCTPFLACAITITKTQGDHLLDVPLAKIGGKGLFTKELEQSLLRGEIDFAVHSLKDLPIELPAGLTIGAYLPRELPNDALISKGNRKLKDLPCGATLATGSLRRKLQLLEYRPDLKFTDIRGNIETRLQKLADNNWAGLILAYAGLQRLEKSELVSEILPTDLMYPAVGQGIIAIECREDAELLALFAGINDRATQICALAERAFLEGMGGGCQIPLGIISRIHDGVLQLSGKFLLEGRCAGVTHSIQGEADQPVLIGKRLAEELLTLCRQAQCI
ncbi:porphobilinogen deaminase [Candidatus Vecturithrix granuli]|uniref:Porphobilinogen deaminase n=1 Tax=Vecturithrix granuli TaxID=1499967 RepID=A0A081C6U4_VECG1|nr:porphobilinogen deaminase [Candidatus Vecturithrix granuli]